MKLFTTNGNGMSGYKIVHMIGAKENFTITKDADTISYESNDGKYKYMVTNVAKFYWRKGVPLVSNWTTESNI